MNHLLSRRQFIRQTSLATTLAGLAPAAISAAAAEPAATPIPSTLFGSNIYGWTQYADREKRPLSIPDVISSLRDCGYDYLESWMNLEPPDENAKFAEQLRSKGLRPVTLYTGARLHEAGPARQAVDKILKAAKVCLDAGFKLISCNPDPIGREKTDDELKTQSAALDDLGQGLTSLGVKIGLHHHLPEMTNRAREFHYNFQHTQKRYVGFCYDVHWVWKGGVPPADALKEYGDRVVSWHLRQSRAGIWWEELDSGDVDYEFVAKVAKDRKLPRNFTVELALEEGTKVTRSAAENHRRSLVYARKVFGA
jgi:inosose dehydratase